MTEISYEGAKIAGLESEVLRLKERLKAAEDVCEHVDGDCSVYPDCMDGICTKCYGLVVAWRALVNNSKANDNTARDQDSENHA